MWRSFRLMKRRVIRTWGQEISDDESAGVGRQHGMETVVSIESGPG